MNTITNTEQSISAVQLIEKKVNRILRVFIATSIIGIVFQLFLIFIRIFNIAAYQVTGLHQALKDANFIFSILFGFCLGILSVTLIFTILITILTIMISIRVKKLQSRWLFVILSILFMIPIISPCFILGFPLGIYSLIFLMKSDVSAAFHR